jgi:hypothetical protein
MIHTNFPTKEFVKAFQYFRIGQATKSGLAVPFDKSTSRPAAQKASQYGASMKEPLNANNHRDMLMMNKNSFVYWQLR